MRERSLRRTSRPWVEAFARVRRRRSVVLGYHGVADSRLVDDPALLQVPPRRFRRQLEVLLSAGFRFVTLAELAARAGGAVPEPGLAAVTFDDGMRNNRTVALPILSDLGITATVYVTISFIGRFSPWIAPSGDGAMLDVSELRELAAVGWELGAHTMTHPDLSTLDPAACAREIGESRRELERIAGVEVRTFAYPFGRYGPSAVDAVRDEGLLAAVTTGSGRWDPFEMTRGMVGHLDPLGLVMLKVTDRYEPLLSTPPMRAVRRASKRVRGLKRRLS